MQKLPDILRRIRIDKKLSQENLAADLNMSITGYAKIERGETDVNYSRLEKIASYYDLTVVELLSYGESGNKTTGITTRKKKLNTLKKSSAA